MMELIYTKEYLMDFLMITYPDFLCFLLYRNASENENPNDFRHTIMMKMVAPKIVKHLRCSIQT